MEVTDERKAYRDKLTELSVEALDLAGARCELAEQMGILYAKQQELGQQMERLGHKELQIHKKRKELASLILNEPVNDPSVQ